MQAIATKAGNRIGKSRLASSIYYRLHRESVGGLHAYWRNPPDEGNKPQSYLHCDARSEFLVGLVDQYSYGKKSSIVELGCNVGRNLNHLFNAGYKNLTGIDINQDALALMKQHYPEMAGQITVQCNPIEDWVRTVQDNAFDVVFVMAVLEHIHPHNSFVFPEIVRITKKYLITIEDERGVTRIEFPRNYKRVFEHLGMEQIQETNCRWVDGLNSDTWARVFCNDDFWRLMF